MAMGALFGLPLSVVVYLGWRLATEGPLTFDNVVIMPTMLIAVTGALSWGLWRGARWMRTVALVVSVLHLVSLAYAAYSLVEFLRDPSYAARRLMFVQDLVLDLAQVALAGTAVAALWPRKGERL